jgi:membrane-bound metal-dependent hydrolase YbcI (DUF457 family)
MANFNTHITCGAIASGLGATVALTSGLAPATEFLAMAGAGIIGSISPDIDLDHSNQVHWLFGVLGMACAFGVVLHIDGLLWWQLALIWGAIFGVVSFGARHLFTHYTAHRGIWHSILAAAFFCAVTIVTLSAVFGKAPAIAWLGGLFMAGGYLVHLVLDEIYAVDLHGRRVKKSFGTALKLWDYHHPANSGIMAGVVLALLLTAPSPKAFVDAAKAATTHSPQSTDHMVAKAGR